MVEIIWKEPPPAVSSDKAPVLAALQKNPGRWALVQPRYKSSSATTAWRKLGCEATHRRSESGKPGEYDVYARWPEVKDQSPEQAETKVDVAKAVATGTALKPPAPAPPRRGSAPVVPANDMGLTKFLADRRARGAVDHPE